MIEIHTHLSKDFGENAGTPFLAWGVTTVRTPRPTRTHVGDREAFESARASDRASSRLVRRSTGRASTIRADVAR